MQLLLPIFPKEAKLVSDILGVYEHDGLIQYIVNGLPVYCHSSEDHNAFSPSCSSSIKNIEK